MRLTPFQEQLLIAAIPAVAQAICDAVVERVTPPRPTPPAPESFSAYVKAKRGAT